jgi:hypothetical protein
MCKIAYTSLKVCGMYLINVTMRWWYMHRSHWQVASKSRLFYHGLTILLWHTQWIWNTEYNTVSRKPPCFPDFSLCNNDLIPRLAQILCRKLFEKRREDIVRAVKCRSYRLVHQVMLMVFPACPIIGSKPHATSETTLKDVKFLRVCLCYSLCSTLTLNITIKQWDHY